MNEAIVLATRFTAAAISEALARRGAGQTYSPENEVTRLTEDLLSPPRRGLDPRGRAANARACIEGLVKRAPNAPFARLLSRNSLDATEQNIVSVLLAWSLDPRVGLLFGHVHDALQRTRPTHAALSEILGDHIGLAVALEPSSSLRRTCIVDVDRWGPEGLLSIDPRIVAYVATGKLPPLAHPAGSLASNPRFDAWESEPIADRPRNVDVLVVRGRAGSGRTRVATAIATSEERLALRLTRCTGELAASLARIALRDARMLGARLIVKGKIDDESAQELADASDVPLALITEPNERPAGPLLARAQVPLDVEPPSAQARAVLWSRFLERDAQDPDIRAVAERYVFTPGTIRRAALQVPAFGIEQAARMQLEGGLEGFAFPRIGSGTSWDRLVLPIPAVEGLRSLCSQARNAVQVERDWGFGRHHALGHGVKALFHGRPGTGKTLAADIVAADLNLPIFRVDLSRIVSKWIGETEQNLALVFERARQSHAILFFDEADSLFAKRTSIQSSTDRYANMEVNYLLQRVEAHDGVIVLATNLKANLDDAFARRLHYVIEFPEPDVAAREQIWRLSVPPEAPLDSDVDFHLLAMRFEIPGGAIKNAVIGAAYLAAGESSPIRQRHIAVALRREYAKLDRLYQKTELDDLAGAPS